jgi:hypothetical protein
LKTGGSMEEDKASRCSWCERYWRLFFETNMNLHKIFKNNNSLIKRSGIVHL